MNKKDLSYFKSVLAAKKEQVLNQSYLNLDEIVNNYQRPRDEGDCAVEEVRQYIKCSMNSKDRMYLIEIEKAFDRIEKGSFGFCEECGMEIPLKRLKAQPFSSLCVDCKEDLELEQKRLA